MDTDKAHEKSIDLFILEQQNLIDTLKLNIEYLKKEITLKKRGLQLYQDSLEHETDFLNNYVKKGIQYGK
jgi:hypothetical protein